MSLAPHLKLPLRVVAGGYVTSEQDTIEEIADCVFAIVAFEPGSRIELMDFGTPDQTFAEGHVDLGRMRADIAKWEPRVNVLADQQLLDMLIEVRLLLKAGSDG